MKIIHTEYSKDNVGHYVPAVEYNGTLYISGQLSINPATQTKVEGGIENETRQALKNLDNILSASGVTRNEVIMCKIYTPDVEYWDIINGIYKEFFEKHKPARVIIPTTALHHDCLIEIEAITKSME
ncbi:RidA family protein [Staphylococcus kloosii]|jgi:2-iminobutanoate/2-iminopropanoate deaminase|uniref:RidA family protein n=1 Tax=Staphylococcus kloosii TaxID=29384 RepID=UPI0018A0E1E6|nr:Rid family detoxifying hydrolase [Staphylococcus kloosii]MBF7024109.1 RidA family protein [Staphylococcus kloosii]